MSKHLADRVSQKLKVSKREASEIIKDVLSSIEEVVAENGSLTLVNFGSFTVKQFKRTSKLKGVEYNVDKNIIRFKTGAGFSKIIN
jgi:nucleoid DNA-binding protein